MRAWLRRVLINPIATMVLAAALAVHALSLPHHQHFGGFSRAGSAIADLLGRPPVFSQPPRYEAYFVREGSSMRRLEPNEQSWDEGVRLLAERPQDVVLLAITLIHQRTGAWALTKESWDWRLSAHYGSDVDQELRATARDSFLGSIPPDMLPKSEAARDALFSMNEVVESRPLWHGIGANVLALSGVVALLVSLRWIPSAPAWVRARRRARALAGGRCPRCGYSIAALPEPRCPECGEDLAPAPVRA